MFFLIWEFQLGTASVKLEEMHDVKCIENKFFNILFTVPVSFKWRVYLVSVIHLLEKHTAIIDIWKKWINEKLNT